jgi:hypothetical protein
VDILQLIIGSLPPWVGEGVILLAMLVIALLAFGRTFIYLMQKYQEGANVPVAIDDGISILVDGIDGSILDRWIEEQIIAGKLPQPLAQAIKVIQNVAHDYDPETPSTARIKLLKLIDEWTDGDINT